MREDQSPEPRPDPGSPTEPPPESLPPTPTPPAGATASPEDRDGFDVPEWVSEFRRLYVEPKTRAALKEQSSRAGRRPGSVPGGGPAGAAGAVGAWDGPEQPLADEPLRSRTEVQRERRSGRGERATRHPETSPPASRAGEADTTGPQAASSRAALRRARQERARAERRMRLRRTVVVGVLLLVVAAVVTWLVARSQEPVSASPAALSAPLVAAAPAGVPAADEAGADEAGADARAVDAPSTGVGREATPLVRRQSPPASEPAEPETGPGRQVPERERTAAEHDGIRSAPPSPTPVSRGTGSFTWVDWGRVPGARTSGGEPVRVALELEGGLGLDAAETARAVARILVDERGWQAARDVRFVFVSPEQAERGEVDTRIGIASRHTTDELCAPLETDGYTSCYNGRVVINLDRWMLGIEAYDGRLDEYRTYVVDHEVGHALGLGHEPCPQRGAPAPVMVPQTLHLWGCAPNPYPVVG